MTIQEDLQEIEAFCDILGLREEPLGLSSPRGPQGGHLSYGPRCCPAPRWRGPASWTGKRPSPISPASSGCSGGPGLKRPACFDQTRFGCLGGTFYLGFLKPQLERIASYISTGQPGVFEGECYLDSPRRCAPLLRGSGSHTGPGAVLRVQAT